MRRHCSVRRCGWPLLLVAAGMTIGYLAQGNVGRKGVVTNVRIQEMSDTTIQGINKTGTTEAHAREEASRPVSDPAGPRPLPLCKQPSGGPEAVNDIEHTWSELEDSLSSMLEPGGRWRPTHCKARYRVAIVVPYRDRDVHLRIFLKTMHPFLQKQNIDYRIYVVEQSAKGPFNRGLARNVGFLESMKLDGADCTVFHDVDLLPLDTRNYYGCSETPRHLCVAVDYINNFKPLYIGSRAMFGGVVSLTERRFREANGYSNLYFGWGAEDDDLYYRIVSDDHSPVRYADEVGRYHGVHHRTEKPNVSAKAMGEKWKILKVFKERQKTDGLSSSWYTVLKVERRKLYTWILFDVENQEKYDAQIVESLAIYDKVYGPEPPAWYELPYAKPHASLKKKLCAEQKSRERKQSETGRRRFAFC